MIGMGVRSIEHQIWVRVKAFAIWITLIEIKQNMKFISKRNGLTITTYLSITNEEINFI
jgi:hypothetical protein